MNGRLAKYVCGYVAYVLEEQLTSSDDFCCIVHADHGDFLLRFLAFYLNDAGSGNAACVATQPEYVRVRVLSNLGLRCEAMGSEIYVSEPSHCSWKSEVQLTSCDRAALFAGGLSVLTRTQM